jgi:hypothetical protein
MTEPEVAAVTKVLADVIREVVRGATGPLESRLALLETTTAATVAEARAAFANELVTVRERVAVVETREPLPGPAGPPGAPGADGKDGKQGLRYCGVWVEGKAYDAGDCATWAGSMWHCNEATSSKPGEQTKLWTLMVKAGRDVGRDTRERGTPWRS